MMTPIKSIKLGEYQLDIFHHVYEPAEDTYMVIDNLHIIKKQSKILDLGSGSGALGIMAYPYAKRIISIDFSPFAVENTKWNFKKNNMYQKSNVIQANYLEKLPINYKFDVILFNPPYLPDSNEDTQDKWLRKSWAIGKGIDAINGAFKQNIQYIIKPNGFVLMISSSITQLDKVFSIIERYRFKARIIDKKSYFLEKLYLIKATKI